MTWTRICVTLLVLAAALPAQQPLFARLHRMMPDRPYDILDLAAGDVDGDGDLDVVAGCKGQNRLFLNDGSGVFTDGTAGRIPPGLQGSLEPTASVDLSDVDGDGDLDILFGNPAYVLAGPTATPTSNNQLLLNDGTGTFTDASATHLPPVAVETADIAVGDADGDGDPDLVITGPVGMYQYDNDGTGVFTDATQTRGPWGVPRYHTVEMADLDGDGDLDLLMGADATSWFHGSVPDRLFLNDGTGTFGQGTWVGAGRTRHMALGDLDGDSDVDAFMATSRQYPIGLLLNSGAGSFVHVSTSQVAPNYAHSRDVALGDVDGDGDLDALVANGGMGLVGAIPATFFNLLMINDGAGHFLPLPAGAFSTVEEETSAALLLDVDGDGDLDAFIGNEGKAPGLLLNDGSGQFTDTEALALPVLNQAINHLAMGDVDGDHDLDLLASVGEQPQAGPDLLLLNDGGGHFAVAPFVQLVPANAATRSSILADLDGDGDLDAVFADAGPNRIYRNDGSGGLAPWPGGGPPAVWDDSWSVAAGDVDGDHDPDLVIGNDGANRLLLNGGDGTFVEAVPGSLPQPRIETRSVALGDVDGDGDLDLVLGVGGSSWGQNRIYMNDGSGRFRDETADRLPTVSDSTIEVLLRDMDGDSDLDLLVGNALISQPYRMLLNDGRGIFSVIPTPFFRASDIAAGDVDGDGDVDVLTANAGLDVLFLNDGSGTLMAAPQGLFAPPEVDTRALALGDIDQDGDLDVVYVARDARSGIHVNLTRQVSWAAIPRYGQLLDFDLFGPAGVPWTLAVSSSRSWWPLGSVGALQLGLTGLTPFAWGTLDAVGTARFSQWIPAAAPGTPARTLFVQGLFLAADPTLTNLETVHFRAQ